MCLGPEGWSDRLDIRTGHGVSIGLYGRVCVWGGGGGDGMGQDEKENEKKVI